MHTEANLESMQPLPGDFAIWIFIFAEILVFGVLFAAFSFARSAHLELFNTSQLTLNRTFGFANTVVLVTSSYFVVRATQSIRAGLSVVCGRWLTCALGAGGVFLALKLIEFHQDSAQGINLSTNLFYMFYLSLTFFHFMHVVMGMVILAVVTYKAFTGHYSANDHTGVETGGSYWHMVDLVWIILFSLVYVLH
ncbi:cytochrome c oxidase subunit 3 [mine drainage metagenome]|uniref:Cytochrome c oxidase subunit 3 n=1 Tax=mine drainage metagenome TaxID=410659 RepID=A0A1J5PZS5_9ZZZZ